MQSQHIHATRLEHLLRLRRQLLALESLNRAPPNAFQPFTSFLWSLACDLAAKGNAIGDGVAGTLVRHRMPLIETVPYVARICHEHGSTLSDSYLVYLAELHAAAAQIFANPFPTFA